MSAKDFDLIHAARTEDLEDNQINDLAVIGKTEAEVIGKLKFSGAHLLQGARGIGKSMLLRKTEAELDKNFKTDRFLAVYVNFKTSTLLEGVKADNKNAFQIWVGAKILQALYEKLIDNGIIASDSSSDPFKRIFGVKTSFGMKKTLQEKIHLLQMLSKNENREEVLKKLGSDDFLDKVNDISYVLEIIREIASEYGINRIVFLFDEAAHTFIPEQQEIFFEIFKLLHGGKIAVKAAVYPSITSYGKNFEIGHDAILITLGAFDPGVTGRDTSRKLYRELITRRIPEGKLRKAIFAKGELLDKCIYLSSGNPRAFLHLFNRVYDRGYTDRALLLATQDYVDQELLPYHLGLSKRLPKYSHHVKLGLDILREYIIPEIRKKNIREKKTQYQSAFFTLPRDVPPNLKLSLNLLCYSGVLSKQGTVKIASRKTGQRYMVHLALLFTEKAFISNKFGDVISMISLTDYREFSATDSSFDQYLEKLRQSAEECQECSSSIPPNAKFCPECGAKVEEKSIVGQLLDDSVREISISPAIADRVEPEYPLVGDVIHATRQELMSIHYIKEVRSKMIKNAAEEYISG